MTTPNLLPRRTMRKPAARRFEADIARACRETFTVEPWQRTPPLRSGTYINQFRDARRAFMRGLPSQLIPLDADLAAIRLAGFSDGRVLVQRPPILDLTGSIISN